MHNVRLHPVSNVMPELLTLPKATDTRFSVTCLRQNATSGVTLGCNENGINLLMGCSKCKILLVHADCFVSYATENLSAVLLDSCKRFSSLGKRENN